MTIKTVFIIGVIVGIIVAYSQILTLFTGFVLGVCYSKQDMIRLYLDRMNVNS